MSDRACSAHLKDGGIRVAPAWCHDCRVEKRLNLKPPAGGRDRSESHALVKVPPLKQTPGKPAKTPKPIVHHPAKAPKAPAPTKHGAPRKAGHAQTHGTPKQEPSAGHAPSNGDGGFNRNTAGEFAPKMIGYGFGIHFSPRLVTKALVETSPEGIPILRLLASGTKLDSQGYDYEGIAVLGEKVTPELLMTMLAEAKGGGVYLLENHHATLPMGESVNGSIENLPDGNQELYVDFALDMANPDTRFLAEKLKADPNYEPQCSVGVFVRREIRYDETEGGYVGFLVEGRFEHVALTRPNHAAYPDADVEELFMADSMEAAMKAAGIVQRVKNATLIETAGDGQKGSTMKTTGETVANGVGLRTVAEAEAASGKPALKTEPDYQVQVARLKESEGEAKKEDEAEDAKESEAEGEAKKEDEAEAESEAKKEGEDEAGNPPPPPPAPPAKPAPAPGGGMGLKDEAMMACREMAGGMHEMMKDGVAGIESGNVDPQDLQDLLVDIEEDFEQLCTMMGVPGYGPGEMEAEAEAEDEAEGEGEAAAPPPPPAAAPAKKPAPAPAAPAKPGADAVEAPEGGGDTHVHAQPGSTVNVAKSTRTERDLKRRLKKQARELEVLKEKVSKIEASADPNQKMPRRYNDGAGLERALSSGGAEVSDAATIDETRETLKEIKDPEERQKASERLALKILLGRFGGQ